MFMDKELPRTSRNIERILEFPEGWTPLDNTFHRCLVKQEHRGCDLSFPFSRSGSMVLISSTHQELCL